MNNHENISEFEQYVDDILYDIWQDNTEHQDEPPYIEDVKNVVEDVVETDINSGYCDDNMIWYPEDYGHRKRLVDDYVNVHYYDYEW